jgi:hypothetical protein
LLQHEVPFARPEQLATVATERSVAGYDAVARNDDPDRRPAHGATDGPRGTWPIDMPGQQAVTADLAPRDLRDGRQDQSVPGRPIREIDRQREAAAVTAEVLLDLSFCFHEEVTGFVVDIAMEAMLEPGDKDLERRESIEGDDAAIADGDVDRSPRCGHGAHPNGCHGHPPSVADAARARPRDVVDHPWLIASDSTGRRPLA